MTDPVTGRRRPLLVPGLLLALACAFVPACGDRTGNRGIAEDASADAPPTDGEQAPPRVSLETVGAPDEVAPTDLGSHPVTFVLRVVDRGREQTLREFEAFARPATLPPAVELIAQRAVDGGIWILLAESGAYAARRATQRGDRWTLSEPAGLHRVVSFSPVTEARLEPEDDGIVATFEHAGGAVYRYALRGPDASGDLLVETLARPE